MFKNKKISEYQKYGTQVIKFDPDSSPAAWAHYQQFYSHNKYLSTHYDFDKQLFYNCYDKVGLEHGRFDGLEWLNYVNKPLGYPDALQKKINIEEEKTEDKRMDTVSEFQKQQIMEIYEVLKNFVSEMNIENEDEYYRIRAMIERKKLVLPGTIFNAILQFMDNVVEEYVFEAEYPDFTEEEAEYENGVMNIKTDAAFNKLMSHFLERLQELDKKIDQFAEQELRAYLLG